MRFFGSGEKKTRKKNKGLPNIRLRNQFAAAKHDRLTAGFRGFTASQDTMIHGGLATMRARSRQLAANNDYAKRYFQLCRSNVIGSQGIRLQARAIFETPDGMQESDEAANNQIERAWRDWSKKKNCSVDGRLSLLDVMQLAAENAAKDGEVFIRIIKGKSAKNKYNFALQMLEADHIDETLNDTLSNGNVIRMGIECNEWNRPVAYHVRTRHPGDTLSYATAKYSERIRIPATEMIHLYRPDRISQSRGMPWLISAMIRLKMLGAYEENEVVAAAVAAAKMGFFISEDGASYTGDDRDDDGVISEAEPGIFEQLPAGVKFESFDPQHPTAGFGAFIKAMLRGVASGLGVSYNSLANDLEGVNFSSIRQGALEERENWKMFQVWIIEHLLQPLYEQFLLINLTSQVIPLPLERIEEFNDVVWRPRGWSWVDPLKEVKSYREANEAGYKTAQDIASEQGADIEEVYAQLAREKRLREKYGLESLGEKKKQPSGIEAGPSEGDEEEDAAEE
jgi:lambda family phage portal protein